MKRITISTLFIVALTISASGQLKPGDIAPDFKLENIDGKMVSLSDYNDQKGAIVVFTCNPCPFAKAYEQRIIKLHNNFAKEGYPVIAINPNDVGVSPDDTMEKMKARAKEKNYPFVYLKDEEGIFKKYGATRTPHVYLLKKEGSSFKVAFIGAIDNNAMDEKKVTEQYVALAINALKKDESPDPQEVKAVGCTIKVKK